MSIIKPATPEDVESLRSCLLLVEQKFGMGTHHTWTESSFRILSDHITTASKRTVSTNTLRRLYDKVVEGDGDYLPKVETKNALAIYLGHKDWYHFVTTKPSTGQNTAIGNGGLDHGAPDPAKLLDSAEIPPHTPQLAERELGDGTSDKGQIKQTVYETTSPEEGSKPRRNNLFWIGALIILIVSGFSLFKLYFKGSFGAVAPSQKYARLVRINHADSTRLPFAQEYKVEYSGYSPDSLFVDVYNHKHGSVTSNRNFFRTRYFVPGVYNVVLRDYEKPLDLDELIIPSKGWQRFVLADETSFAYPESSSMTEATNLTKSELTNLALKAKQGLRTQYENIGNIDFPTNDFDLTARVKNSSLVNDLDCYSTKLKVLGANGSFVVCFTMPNCSRLTYNTFSEVVITGTKLPQESLAIDLTKWRTISLTVINKIAQVGVDGKVVFSVPFTKEIGKLRGIEFRFEGDGKAEYITVKNSKGALLHHYDFSKSSN